MALIVCPECGAEISDASTTCVKCGYPLVASSGYEVVVTDYSGTYKSKAISAISDVCGYSLADARTIINDLPQTIITDVDESTAIKIAQALDAEGIDASVYKDETEIAYTSTRSNGSGLFKTLGTLLLINSLNRRYYRPRHYYSRRRGFNYRPLGFNNPKPVAKRPASYGRNMGPSPRGGFGGNNPQPNNRSVRNSQPRNAGLVSRNNAQPMGQKSMGGAKQGGSSRQSGGARQNGGARQSGGPQGGGARGGRK